MLPLMALEDVTHRDLWIAVTDLSGSVKGIHQLLLERKEVVDKLEKDVNSLFNRQRSVEGRLGKIAGIGIVGALLITCFTTLLAAAIPFMMQHMMMQRNTQPTQSEVRQ